MSDDHEQGWLAKERAMLKRLGVKNPSEGGQVVKPAKRQDSPPPQMEAPKPEQNWPFGDDEF